MTLERPMFPPRDESNVVKFPYSASRRVHSKKPRRSKNGTPEERAAKVATLETAPADIVSMSRVRAEAYSEVDRINLPVPDLGQAVLNLATEHDR
jgi:hypothetical protein